MNNYIQLIFFAIETIDLIKNLSVRLQKVKNVSDRLLNIRKPTRVDSFRPDSSLNQPSDQNKFLVPSQPLKEYAEHNFVREASSRCSAFASVGNCRASIKGFEKEISNKKKVLRVESHPYRRNTDVNVTIDRVKNSMVIHVTEMKIKSKNDLTLGRTVSL